jgi:GT2 family glycosyltransferase/SAM-dependent methyltransferase
MRNKLKGLRRVQMQREDRARENVLIEIGGGETPHRPSYLHLDARVLPGVDVISDARHLPLRSATVNEIYTAHLIEHLSYDEGRELLAEAWRILKDGGRLEISCPDLEQAIRIYRTVPDLSHRVGTVDLLSSILYGAQTHEFDFHRAGYDFKLLSDGLRTAGFAKIRRLPPGVESHPTQPRSVRMLYELHIEAFKTKQDRTAESMQQTNELVGTEYFVAELALRNEKIAKLETELLHLGRIISEKDENTRSLQDELENSRRIISEKDENTRSLQDELENSRRIISEKDENTRGLESDLGSAKLAFSRATTELSTIKESFGYRFMRFHASRIDRLFPDRTSRGEFRKVVTASLRIITGQGIVSFSRQALEKIGRKEFRITEPMHRETGRESGPGISDRTHVVITTGMRVGLGDEELVRGLREFLSSAHGVLELPYYRDPIVSVVIVTYNKAHYTLRCLRDLHLNTSIPYEVIIVDNASSDETSVLLPRLRNITTLLNTENLFFSRGCNQGARTARGKYLLFLNNDVFVHEDCVSWLTKTLESDSDVGGAGAKLVWRDGRIQEAGSIIWPDGSAHGYGRGDDPSKSQYCYARDVDFCSAACLIVRRDAFEKLGGFDEAFTPAYYEDADLCMRLWNAGYRVVYQPLAIATHIEFGSSSSETARNLMEKHRAVFLGKHSSILKGRPIPPHYLE